MTEVAKKAAPVAIPFEHGPRAPVYVLVPVDVSDQRMCLEYLEIAFQKCEKEPVVRPELVLGKLRYDGFLYVVHPIAERRKNDKGVWEYTQDIYVSAPITLSGFATQGELDYAMENGIDVLKLRTAIQAACDNKRAGVPITKPNGVVTTSGANYRAQLSGDPELSRQSVKLFNS